MPGKPIDDVARELGLDPATIVKLASNENPRGPSAKVLAAIAAAAADVTRYPDGFGYDAEGRARAAAGRRGRASSCSATAPTTSSSSRRRRTCGRATPPSSRSTRSPCIRSPRRRAARSASRCRRATSGTTSPRCARRSRRSTRIVFVANPNNPTGTWIAPAALEAFIASVPHDVLVVLDEAYNEYLEPADRADSVGWIAKYPNLLVSRSFSKAYGLAALRDRLRRHGCRRRRHAEPRAPAVQRERARAGGGDRRARRRRVRRREPRAQPRGLRAARRRARRARAFPTCRRTATSCSRRSAMPRASTSRCCSRASSCVRSRATACPSGCASRSDCRRRTTASWRRWLGARALTRRCAASALASTFPVLVPEASKCASRSSSSSASA